jgi:methylated-DNA-[protein]-cysteine S-methyltransferase
MIDSTGNPIEGQYTGMDSPVGALCIFATDETITKVTWHHTTTRSNSPVLSRAVEQLKAYFAGDLTDFDLPLAPTGGPFQLKVCAAMSRIPFGQTTTYGTIAAELGSAAQPIGNACGGNSIPIIIPCHRVLAANGLGGFSGAGGVETKIALLKHEDAFRYLL